MVAVARGGPPRGTIPAMPRRRRPPRVLAAGAAVLLAAVVGLWVRSYWREDGVLFARAVAPDQATWYGFVHRSVSDCKRQLWMDETGTSGDLAEIAHWVSVLKVSPGAAEDPTSLTPYDLYAFEATLTESETVSVQGAPAEQVHAALAIKSHAVEVVPTGN